MHLRHDPSSRGACLRAPPARSQGRFLRQALLSAGLRVLVTGLQASGGPLRRGGMYMWLRVPSKRTHKQVEKQRKLKWIKNKYVRSGLSCHVEVTVNMCGGSYGLYVKLR